MHGEIYVAYGCGHAVQEFRGRFSGAEGLRIMELARRHPCPACRVIAAALAERDRRERAAVGQRELDWGVEP